MKITQLRQLIREEIQSVIKEDKIHIKVINKGLNKFGAEQMNKAFKSNREKYPEAIDDYFFKVGDKIGKPSKVIKQPKLFNSNPGKTSMGLYHVHSVDQGIIEIPLEWLDYDTKTFKTVEI
jgi:hypothetical protein